MGAKKGYFYIVVTIIMFTSYEVVLKFISGQLNSMQLTLCRFSVGFLILLPLALHTLKKRGERLDGKSIAYFALLGLLGIALSMPILHVSVNYAGSSVAAVLFSCNPVFVTFLAFFLLKEPILPRHIAALVLEVAGSEDTFRLAWECARPNAVVTVVALYDEPQVLPLPDMYGKNLTFKTGGVDGCDSQEILDLIAAGKLDPPPLITHTFPLREIEAAYDLFEHRRDGVIKVAVDCSMA